MAASAPNNSHRLVDAFFPDSRRLAAQIAQVVQTGTADPSLAHQFDLVDPGRAEGKGFFDANPVRDLAYGNTGAHGPFATADNNPLEKLGPFLAALNDPDMHPHGITGPKVRDVIPHILFFNLLNDVHSFSSFNPLW